MRSVGNNNDTVCVTCLFLILGAVVGIGMVLISTLVMLLK